MIGSLLGWLVGAVVLTLAGLLLVVILRHNLHIRRVRRIYKSLPTWIEGQVLRLIQEEATKRPSLTFLRLDEENSSDGGDLVLRSHVGGVPYAEAEEEWPTAPETRFLLQVRLDEPSLGEKWQGRLLTVFLVFDVEQVVRSYAAPSFEKHVPLVSTAAPLPCVKLTSIRLPLDDELREDEDDEHRRYPALPTRLCAMIPALRDVLSPFGADPVGLLTQILRPNVYGYDLETWQIAYEGGDPTPIQEPNNPACDVCGKPMRFLLQFGEIIPDFQLADAGICYVYGCDDHPECCKGFIESH